MSLFRNIVESVLEADPSKTQYKAVLALLYKTIGFGKAKDPCSWSQLEKLTGVRRDHLKKAMKELDTLGLFHQEKHAKFNYTYSVGSKFLDECNGSFFTPSIPSSGKSITKTREEAPQELVTYTIKLYNNPRGRTKPT